MEVHCTGANGVPTQPTVQPTPHPEPDQPMSALGVWVNREDGEDSQHQDGEDGEEGPKKEGRDTAAGPKKPSPYDDPVFKELSKINGEINRLRLDQLKRRLKAQGLDTRGKRDVLKKRLKAHYRNIKLEDRGLDLPELSRNLYYHYYIVIDFEATCDSDKPNNYRHEIIEFPAVLICTKTMRTVSHFHSYVRPTINRQLSNFCTSLTGITQDKVNTAPRFPEVAKQFEAWLDQQGLLAEGVKFAVLTDGPWDMGRFLYGQCHESNVPYPSWAMRWINIKKTYSNFYNTKRLCLKDMLARLGLQFEGQPHCGLDDSRNIARVALRLLRDGANMRVNEGIILRKGPYRPNERVVRKISRSGFEKLKRMEAGQSNGGSHHLEDEEELEEEEEEEEEGDELVPPFDPTNTDDFPALTSSRGQKS